MIPRPLSVFDQRNSVIIPSVVSRNDSLFGVSSRKRSISCCSSDDDNDTNGNSNNLATNRTSCRRRVSFDESSNVSYDEADYSPTFIGRCSKRDCLPLWYTRHEHRQLKTQNTNNAKDILRFEMTKTEHNDYRPVIERMFAACCFKTTDIDDDDQPLVNDNDQLRLEAWIAAGAADGRLGLERLTVRALRLDKSSRRRELLSTVLELQEEYAETLPNERAEIVAQEAKQISRPSRLFAAHWARAQANCQV